MWLSAMEDLQSLNLSTNRRVFADTLRNDVCDAFDDLLFIFQSVNIFLHEFK